MSYLKFTTEAEAITAISQIDSNYSAPILLSNGYEMETWETPSKAISNNIWWVQKPERDLNGITCEDAMLGVTGYTEIESLDPTWLPSFVS